MGISKVHKAVKEQNPTWQVRGNRGASGGRRAERGGGADGCAAAGALPALFAFRELTPSLQCSEDRVKKILADMVVIVDGKMKKGAVQAVNESLSNYASRGSEGRAGKDSLLSIGHAG